MPKPADPLPGIPPLPAGLASPALEFGPCEIGVLLENSFLLRKWPPYNLLSHLRQKVAGRRLDARGQPRTPRPVKNRRSSGMDSHLGFSEDPPRHPKSASATNAGNRPRPTGKDAASRSGATWCRTPWRCAMAGQLSRRQSLLTTSPTCRQDTLVNGREVS